MNEEKEYKFITNAMLTNLTPVEFEKYFESILIDSGVDVDRANIIMKLLIDYGDYSNSEGFDQICY